MQKGVTSKQVSSTSHLLAQYQGYYKPCTRKQQSYTRPTQHSTHKATTLHMKQNTIHMFDYTTYVYVIMMLSDYFN